ncbi:MAG: DotA/TraY family protein [Candidatus Competibacteraceae bacterium]|nr:DotA/TraY family protein [Candidatus Competibacteraceae bacterium]
MTLPTAESVFHRPQWVVLLMLVTLLTPTVHAQAVPPPPDPAFTFDPNQNLEPTGGDLSLQLLEGILGSVISRVRLTDGLNASDAGPFGEMFSLFNGFLLFLLGILLFIKLVAALLDTAHEGEALGQDRSTTWTPIRIVLSASMLIPLVNGYSFIQVIVLWVTLSGVGLADAVWSTAVQQFTQTTLFAPPPRRRRDNWRSPCWPQCLRAGGDGPAGAGEPRVTRCVMRLAQGHWAITKNAVGVGR